MISNVTNVVRLRFLPTVIVICTVAILFYVYSCDWNLCFLKNTSFRKKWSRFTGKINHQAKDLAWKTVNASRDSSAKTQVNILCFGDSITEGVVSFSGYFDTHPYTIKLDKLLNSKIQDVKFNIFNRGLSGEHVQGQMIHRLSTILDSSKVHFDGIVILGGTNDIRRAMWFEDFDDELVYKSLAQLHSYCHKNKIKTVVVTIPARQCEIDKECSKVKTMRLKINRKLKEFVKEMGKDKVILVDLAEKLPYHALSDEERKKYWVDEVHFTYEGYDKMAEIIYDVIKSENFFMS